MLRITIHEGAKAQTIQLEGKIVGPWVEEFNRAWHLLAPSLGSKELHLDLRGVAFVSSRAESILVPQSLTAVAKAPLGLGTALYPVPLLAMNTMTEMKPTVKA